MEELTAYEKAKLEREKGKRGENKGIPMPVNWVRMKKILPNVQARYYVILSDSGVFKQAVCNRNIINYYC